MSPNNKEEAASQKSYDSSFKEWITNQARDILPILVEGVEYKKDLDVQTILPAMSADKVFKVKYYGEEWIFHLEFEVGVDPDLLSRLLVYNTVLYRKHGKPVLTMVVYPFHAKMPRSPLIIGKGKREVHRFHFKTLSLSTMDARECVRRHQTCLYPLLPAMHGLHPNLMSQVLSEMSELYRDGDSTFSEQFSWMKLFLERTNTLKPFEKGKIWERLIMFDRLWEESPMVQEMKKQSREEGKTEGIILGEVQGLQRSLVKYVQRRFPQLTELAQTKVKLVNDSEALEVLYEQVQDAVDAKAVQQLLVSISEQ
jgi:hypothetical protein